MSRHSTCLVALVVCTLQGSAALGEARWVDDGGVLDPRQARLRCGIGAGLLSGAAPHGQTIYSPGGGLNLEGAVGLGANFEVGARVGHRVVAQGSGLRGDEIARLDDTETYGTGLDNLPNPELRLRWRGYGWAWGEVGVENRFALPLEAEKLTAEVLGVWASVHLWRRARVDAGLNSVFSWHWFASGRVLEIGLGVPVRLWANLTQGLFVGIITAPHHSWGTSFTTAHTELLLGVAAGYRLGRCDLLTVTSSRNVVEGLLSRVGLGIGVSCRI